MEPSQRHSPPRQPTDWRAAWWSVLGFVLPVDCVVCGAPDRALCPGCRAALDDRPRRVRLVAGVRCDAAFEYEGIVRTLLLELKLRARVDVAGALARRFGATVDRALAASPAGTVLLRVPPSPRGARRRGFDPVVLLLRRGGVRSGRALRRVRPGRTPTGRGGAVAADQKERGATERVEATVGSLRACGVEGRTVVLVDDVVTTGVTMAEAVRAVRVAGGTVVRCVAVASVEE